MSNVHSPEKGVVTPEEVAAYWKGAYERMAARNIEAAVEIERLTARDSEMAAECNRLIEVVESTALELTKSLVANDLLRRQVSDLENKDHARIDAAIARATEGV